MSTRCQVRVTQEGMGWDKSVTLYHHTDGYPECILGLIKKAWELGDTLFPCEGYENWRIGRAGKAASLLCAVDPGVFEPEEGHGLHGDIEYYYELFVNNHNGAVTWEIAVYVPQDGFGQKGNPTLGDMKKILARQPLEAVVDEKGAMDESEVLCAVDRG